MIYFAQSVEGGPVKIGYSDDVPTRLRQLEGHYGQPLALLATLPGGRDEEQAVHARFAHLRFGRTEQFRPAADLMAFIGRPLLVGANPETVELMEGALKTVAVKGSSEWAEWLDRLSHHQRTSVPSLTDRALAELAQRVGFEEPPPRL